MLGLDSHDLGTVMGRLRFRKDERGLALTEYLLLLGLLTGGTLFSVQAVGGKMGAGWQSWAGVYETLKDLVPGQNEKDRKETPCQNGIDHGNAEVSNCGGN